MKHRLAAAAALLLGAAALAPAQPAGTYSKAVPPDKAVLDRLNLKAEWTQFLPVEGNRDALLQVQTIDDQVFVQTRAGLLIAIDALTGRIQWAARLGGGTYGNAYPVAANSRYVFVAHVTKLYGFYRYTGTTEFVADLGSPPTVGLAADERAVYCVLGMRPRVAGAHRVAVYDLPRPIVVAEPAKAAVDPLGQGAKAATTGPVDDLVKRYNPGGYGAPDQDRFEPAYRSRVQEMPVGGITGARTPSLQTLPSVVPPFDLGNRGRAPSLTSVASLRQPYHVRTDASRYVQQTPSLSTIPPSVAAALALTDLRPKAVEPPLRWEYGLNARVLYPLVLTPTRVWAITEGNVVIALNKLSEAGKVVTEVKETLTSPIAAAPVASGLTHFIPMGNGTLVAIDAASGNLSGGAIVRWRAVPGGINNHSPFVTKDRVYASGDDTGVVCLYRFDGPIKGDKPARAPEPKGADPKADPAAPADPKGAPKADPDDVLRVEARAREYHAGEIAWRSDDNADQVIGANEEFVYIRDRQGRFLVFDANRATDPVHKRSAPLGSANLSEFNVNVVNTVSDRVYLAADNGVLVCLRDARAKYAKPVRMWPPPDVNPASRVGVDTLGGDKKDPPKAP